MSKKLIIPTLAVLAAASYSQAAVTFNSSTFNGLESSNVDTTGLIDWGYVSSQTGFLASDPVNVDYSTLTDGTSNVITTVSGSSKIGTVTITEEVTIDDATGVPNLTFDSNNAYGTGRNFGTTEDYFSMTFNDLGVGQFAITLYVGHSNASRIYRVNYSGTGATGGTTDMTGGFGTYTTAVSGMLAYTATFSTTDASDDVTLFVTNAPGSSGSGGPTFSGYTVEAVPEPSAFALLAGLAGLTWVMARRRRA